MTEKLATAAQDLQKQMKMVKERNENIVKAHNNGLSKKEMLETFKVSEDILEKVLKTAKRDGLLKSPVMEEKKPRRGRPPVKPQEESKPLLKENEVKPKRAKKPRQEAIEENLEKVSPEVKEVIESFAPEKKEEPIAAREDKQEEPEKAVEEKEEFWTKAQIESYLEKTKVAEQLAREPKPTPFIAKAVEQVKDLYADTIELMVNGGRVKIPLARYEIVGEDNINNELNKETENLLKIIEEKDHEIHQLKTQLERFDYLQDLSLLLMRNTIALVDQAEEKRLEGYQ